MKVDRPLAASGATTAAAADSCRRNSSAKKACALSCYALYRALRRLAAHWPTREQKGGINIRRRKEQEGDEKEEWKLLEIRDEENCYSSALLPHNLHMVPYLQPKFASST